MAKKKESYKMDAAEILAGVNKGKAARAVKTIIEGPAAHEEARPDQIRTAAEDTTSTRRGYNEDTKTEGGALASINVRLPREIRDRLQEMAAAAEMQTAVYMRLVLTAAADPAADPELSKELLQIERDRPRNVTALKAKISKRQPGQMVGNTIRLPQETIDRLQEAAAFRGLTLSLYLRYIFTALARRSAEQ